MFKNFYRTNGNTSKVVTCKTFVITILHFRYWHYVTISKAIWHIWRPPAQLVSINNINIHNLVSITVQFIGTSCGRVHSLHACYPQFQSDICLGYIFD